MAQDSHGYRLWATRVSELVLHPVAQGVHGHLLVCHGLAQAFHQHGRAHVTPTGFGISVEDGLFWGLALRDLRKRCHGFYREWHRACRVLGL